MRKPLRFKMSCNLFIEPSNPVHYVIARNQNPDCTTDADSIIRNTYKTLLTRGQKGCYIYCEDTALSEYIKRMLGVK